MTKYATWFEVWNDGTEFEVDFRFDENGEFDDVTESGKKMLAKHGIEDVGEWLGETEYPIEWKKYDIRWEE